MSVLLVVWCWCDDDEWCWWCWCYGGRWWCGCCAGDVSGNFPMLAWTQMTPPSRSHRSFKSTAQEWTLVSQSLSSVFSSRLLKCVLVQWWSWWWLITLLNLSWTQWSCGCACGVLRGRSDWKQHRIDWFNTPSHLMLAGCLWFINAQYWCWWWFRFRTGIAKTKTCDTILGEAEEKLWRELVQWTMFTCLR